MSERPEQETTIALAKALLDVLPKVLQRVGADLPLDSEPPGLEAFPNWRDVVELRATLGQITLMRILVEYKRCMMQELAEHLTVAPSTVTAMVKRLLAQGYVERGHDEVDWRTVWITPTERGRTVVAVFDCARAASLQRRLNQLSEDECASLAAALPVMRHLLEVSSP